MKILTAGESHGKGLCAIVEGLPAGLKVDLEKINLELARRSGGFGRGARQQIEKDRVEFLTGVFAGETTGSPVTLWIKNQDFWEKVYAGEEKRPLSRPRPGHADLAGMQKFLIDDARTLSERASARETAIRTAVGALCKQFLEELGIRVTGFVRSVGTISCEGEIPFDEIEKRRGTLLGMSEKEAEKEAVKLIQSAEERGDTLGGIVELRAAKLKAGFGSCMSASQKLDAKIAFALMSVQAIKGVEFGLGFSASEKMGSCVQDEIFWKEGKPFRKTNRAGGIEGGMTNGEEIVVRAAMKPIPTLKRGLKTIDMQTKTPALGASERADVCAVTACEVILENVLATVLLEAVSERLGGDTLSEWKERYEKLL